MSKTEKKRKGGSRRGSSSPETATLKKTKTTKTPPPCDPSALENFRLSDSLKSRLKEKGIQRLFPIQAQTFDLVLDGVDVVARAKTGSGKTLAFVLPIVEQLLKETGIRRRGRGPSVLCLTPTRELAKQVCSECEYIGTAGKLRSVCMYGSSPYFIQEREIAEGFDILVGTPGRIKDHINRGNLNFSSLKIQILDECDQMVQMGFVEDVEFILNAVGQRDHIQTLLFSATLPSWVKSLLKKFCKNGYQTIDLMSSESTLSTNTVEHKCLMVERHLMGDVLIDLVHYHGDGGRTIVFVDTKMECDRITEKLASSVKARAIHGDLQQRTRELTLDLFRRGQLDVLVATDVAARGLDIPEVELVIQTAPPKDVESYVHRAGRTGRAERNGVCICLMNRSNEFFLGRIEQQGGVKFSRIEAPQIADMVTIASRKANANLRAVKFHTTEMFKEMAEQMLQEWKDPTTLVASALAYVTGHSKAQQRSLILKLDNHVTMKLTSTPSIRSLRMEDVIKKIKAVSENLQPKGIRLLADGSGAVFEIHEESVQDLLQAFPEDSDSQVELTTSLPPLKVFSQSSSFRNGRFGNSGGVKVLQNRDRFRNSSRNSLRNHYR